MRGTDAGGAESTPTEKWEKWKKWRIYLGSQRKSIRGKQTKKRENVKADGKAYVKRYGESIRGKTAKKQTKKYTWRSHQKSKQKRIRGEANGKAYVKRYGESKRRREEERDAVTYGRSILALKLLFFRNAQFLRKTIFVKNCAFSTKY